MFLFFPLINFFTIALGIFCLISNWKVKIGKMFCSASMISFVNHIMLTLLWILVQYFKGEANWYYLVIKYFLPKVLISLFMSYFACLQVSKIQSYKTLTKTLYSNIKVN